MVIGRECGTKQRQRALFPFILPYKNFRKGLTRYFVFLQRISFAIFIYVPVIFERFYRRRKNKMKLFLHYLSSYWTIIASDYYRAFIAISVSIDDHQSDLILTSLGLAQRECSRNTGSGSPGRRYLESNHRYSY